MIKRMGEEIMNWIKERGRNPQPMKYRDWSKWWEHELKDKR